MKTILITGTTNGIGRVTALNLARQGHKIVMANRNRQKSELLASEITRDTGNADISLLDLDLSSPSSVRQCAQEIKATHSKLDFDSFKGGKKYNANAAYAQSKLAMQLNAMELA